MSARHAVPAIYARHEYAEASGLMSYGTNQTEAYRQVGIYAGRILNGAKPADLPVVQSSKFELVIGVLKNHQEWGPSMSEITTIGLDLGKHVFQAHVPPPAAAQCWRSSAEFRAA